MVSSRFPTTIISPFTLTLLTSGHSHIGAPFPNPNSTIRFLIPTYMGSLNSCQLTTLWILIFLISGIAVLLVVSTQMSSSSDQKGWTFLYSFPPTRCVWSIRKKLFAGFPEKDLSFRKSNEGNFWKNFQNPSSWTKNYSIISSMSSQLGTVFNFSEVSVFQPTYLQQCFIVVQLSARKLKYPLNSTITSRLFLMKNLYHRFLIILLRQMFAWMISIYLSRKSQWYWKSVKSPVIQGQTL